eukprot:TRINITY_DN3791_c0_g4_i4.p1 TRINITY_DN3791_c0_g4~~TRINITY_DN3791_c0_g4_i4.p1  ORF type:complete len:596 (+),score=156.60 TRINITY_DN3791_c0_g4_i4:115-1902(+)
MIRRPPRSTLSSSSAASDVYKRQVSTQSTGVAASRIMSDILAVWLPIVGLVVLSGLFSGLTLGLLSLDIKQLEIVIKAGDENEKKYAKRILPTRRHGNWLLCTLLLGNVAVNAMLSILLANMTSGLMGFLLSTALIVIFGEILPQATCSRYGLAIGYYTVPLVWVIMAVCAVIAWPISFVLDKALGEEMGQIYTRNMFKSLVKQHAEEVSADFNAAESSIICQVIEMQEKKVTDILTPLDQVFGMEYNAKLDFEQLAAIMECGHSRIPVYNGSIHDGIIGLLFAKDLVLLNPEDEFKVKDILHYYNHLPLFVEVEDMNCSQLLNLLLEGNSHLGVCRNIVENPNGGDNTYRNIGIVTLEDVIAQLLGKHEPEEAAEVMSATPTSKDGVKEQRQFIDMFRRKKTHNSLSPHEVTMIYQILIAKVPAFEPSKIPKAAVLHLLKGATIEEMSPENHLYEKGIPTNVFTLLLEGHVEIVCGQEGFMVEVGPWTPLGSKALSVPEYRPDFSATPRQGTVNAIKYLQISMETYERYMNMDCAAPSTGSPDGHLQLPDTTSYAGIPAGALRSRNSSRNTSRVNVRTPTAVNIELEAKSDEQH